MCSFFFFCFSNRGQETRCRVRGSGSRAGWLRLRGRLPLASAAGFRCFPSLVTSFWLCTQHRYTVFLFWRAWDSERWHRCVYVLGMIVLALALSLLGTCLCHSLSCVDSEFKGGCTESYCALVFSQPRDQGGKKKAKKKKNSPSVFAQAGTDLPDVFLLPYRARPQ